MLKLNLPSINFPHMTRNQLKFCFVQQIKTHSASTYVLVDGQWYILKGCKNG